MKCVILDLRRILHVTLIRRECSVGRNVYETLAADNHSQQQKPQAIRCKQTLNERNLKKNSELGF